VTGRKAIILLTDGKDVGSRVTAADLIYSLQESDVMVYSVFFKTGEILQQMRPRNDRRDDIFGRQFPRFPGRRNDPFPQRRRDNPQRRDRVERENERATDFLEKLSEVTAGRFYESNSSKLKETFGLIIDELRHQYRLGFYPADDMVETTHAIKVKVSRPDVVVRARSNFRTQTRR